MRRDEISAVMPATAEAARRVPRVPLRRFAPLWRAQFEPRDPWWWSRRSAPGGGGRCTLAAPHGTVSFATTAVGALIEKLWDPGLAHPNDAGPQPVTRRALGRLVLWESADDPPEASVADLTDATGGLPKEFCAAPYGLTQGWADTLHADGAQGLAHWLRLDPDDGRGVALFATGPDDGRPSFSYEAFPLRPAAHGLDYAEKLPVQLFQVVDALSDDEVTHGDIDDVPLA